MSFHVMNGLSYRLKVTSVLLATLGGVALVGGGCELLVAPDRRKIPDPTGSGGNGGGGGDTGGGGAAPECTTENVATKCGADTTCKKWSCSAGKCGESDAAKGSACTEDGGVVCDGSGNCVAEHCADGVTNAGETDVDCGGTCAPCANELHCADEGDCNSGYCQAAGGSGGSAGGGAGGTAGAGGSGGSAMTLGVCAPCGEHVDCQEGSWCDASVDAGTCTKLKDNGVACELGRECSTGFCPASDKVCADTACSATCESALEKNTGVADGTCAPVTVDTDPDDECATNDSTCSEAVCGGTAGSCKPAANTVVCRTQAGDCDLAESCTGVAVGCPADQFVAIDTNCGDAEAACVNQDKCDGAGACTNNGFKTEGTNCGDAGTECTYQDSCSGNSAACTDNGFKVVGTSCGDAEAVCVNQDTCNGAGACTNNGFKANTTNCGDAGTECTNQDTCSGNSAACTDNGFRPVGTSCGEGTCTNGICHLGPE